MPLLISTFALNLKFKLESESQPWLFECPPEVLCAQLFSQWWQKLLNGKLWLATLNHPEPTGRSGLALLKLVVDCLPWHWVPPHSWSLLHLLTPLQSSSASFQHRIHSWLTHQSHPGLCILPSCLKAVWSGRLLYDTCISCVTFPSHEQRSAWLCNTIGTVTACYWQCFNICGVSSCSLQQRFKQSWNRPGFKLYFYGGVQALSSFHPPSWCVFLLKLCTFE